MSGELISTYKFRDSYDIPYGNWAWPKSIGGRALEGFFERASINGVPGNLSL
ncbi:Hypothetical protein FKW44_006825 [Caligus rogercresseyi]|uniref:Uncharacterized protein n=1 Tax=Caligus rogercresseyi TaxID=217165 RepID=A0A7T8QT62_CALRO|nr:Hypothetical protein FKW44_006825 [Caligus rogercresseyi]